MRIFFVVIILVSLQYTTYSQCQNTNQNPANFVLGPSFSGYKMEVSNSITAGDYFGLYFNNNFSEEVTIDVASGGPVYIHVYQEGSLIADGPTPVSAFFNYIDSYQIHINTISPLCGSDNINRTITLECKDCPLHLGSGIGVDEIDRSAALHIGNSQGGLLLPFNDYVNDLPTPSEGLLYYNNIEKELKFFDGQDWKSTFSLPNTESRFDFKQNTNNFDGTDGTLISIFNTNIGNNRMSGLRFINGPTEFWSSAAIFYRNNKLHFAEKTGLGSIITIEDSFLEMDKTSLNFTGEHVALGLNTDASGDYATALGINTIASGEGSTAMGRETEASGIYSTAMGFGTEASGVYSTAMGVGTKASSFYDTAMGRGTVASGNYSTAMGKYTIASNPHQLAIGSYNAQSLFHAFVIGDGSATNARSNSFYVSITGNAWLQGTLSQNSDQRLKKHITPLRSSLASLQQLKGYNYYWKEKTRDRGLQSGVLAQEIQTVFPHLVEKEEDGYLSVNYIGLIPHLIEASKELKTENDQLNVELKEVKKQFDLLNKRIEVLERKSH